MPNYEWKSIRTNEQELSRALNEVQEKTEWEVFSVFSHTSQTKYRLYTTTTLVVVLRKPLPDPPLRKATVAEIGSFRHIAEHIENMEPKDVRRGFIAAGIITDKGQLVEKYRKDNE